MFATPRYLKSGITTIPQLFGQRYDRLHQAAVLIAYILSVPIVQLPVILYSGSLVFENIFNLSGILALPSSSLSSSCVCISIIGSIYAIFGGLKAVAVSDTINGIGLLIGGLMIPFLALNVLGHASGGGRYCHHGRCQVPHPNRPDKLNSIAPADALNRLFRGRLCSPV